MRRMYALLLVICLIFLGTFCPGCIYPELDQANILVQNLSPVAAGKGVPQAAAYTMGVGSHPFVFISSSGTAHRWSVWGLVEPKAYQAKTVAETQLVAVVGEETSTFIEECLYTGGPSVIRYQKHLNVTLREAKTGNLVSEKTFSGSYPPDCSKTERYKVTALYGDPVSDGQVWNWLKSYVVT
jgi:hypothetical protein